MEQVIAENADVVEEALEKHWDLLCAADERAVLTEAEVGGLLRRSWHCMAMLDSMRCIGVVPFHEP
jgi:hypothetical protein